jgi:CheY-like chemotaxis protein
MPTAASYSPSQGRPSANSPLRILIVDDNRAVVETLTLLLESSGNMTYAAYDGLEAVRLAQELQPDVILLDIGLPKIDGYEACRRIRKHERGRRKMVFALTGLAYDDASHESRSAGFDMHLVKPVEPEILLTVLAATPRAT